MRALWTSLALCLSVVSIAEAGRVAERAAERFRRERPEAMLYKTDARITHIYGPSMGFGATPRDAADAFIENHAEMFGVVPTDLRFKRSFELMHGKFTAVQYDQFYQGIEVRLPDSSAGITILTRADVGHGIVLISADLYDLLGLRLAPAVISGDQAVASVAVQSPGFTFTQPELAIFAGEGGPALAQRFVGERGNLADFEKYEFFVDAAKRGAPILHRGSLIYYSDVEGHVSGWASQGIGSDQCAPDGLEGLAYAWVEIDGGDGAFADEHGDFIIPHEGTDPVIVRSPIRGRYFRVYNQAGIDALLEQEVTPPGPANFEHNPQREEFTRAEVNAYVEANVVRDHTLRFSPDFPVIRDQTEFPINVNIDLSCNAFYTGESIEFLTSNFRCANSAFGTIVHHEYGHHLVAITGNGGGEYAEGAGDTMGVVIMDDPRGGVGFYRNCNGWSRNAENFREYPCPGGSHDCAQLLSGCVWDTRNELIFTEPDHYRETISSLWINSIPLHRGIDITPEITIDFLTLDDDDDDIRNGTPHYAEIDAGFGRHNMDAPPLVMVAFHFPNGRPDLIAPGGGDRVRVELENVLAEAEPGTGMLHYRTDGQFALLPMEGIEHNVYDIIFPPAECGQIVQYFVSALTTNGEQVNEPMDAPETVFQTLSTEVEFADDFEQENGWTVVNENVQEGAFERAVPFGRGGGAPQFDYDGSGQCYITGNQPFVDLDGGPTRLISPVMDLSQGAFQLSYARYFVGVSSDSLTVELSTDAGQTWQVIETISREETGWFESAWNLNDLAEPTSTMRFRFSGLDAGTNSLVELAVDAFLLTRCADLGGCVRDPEWVCDGDVDGDGQVNPVDSGLVQAAFGSTHEQDVCNYDVDCDGQINPVDSGIVQSLFGMCDPPRETCP